MRNGGEQMNQDRMNEVPKSSSLRIWLGVIIVAAVLGIGGYYLGILRQSAKVPDITTTSASATSAIPATTKNDTQSKSNHLIYWSKSSLSNQFLSVGDIWMYNTQDATKRQVTSSGLIWHVYEVSPDQTQIAVSLSDPRTDRARYDLAIISLQDGNTRKLIENAETQPRAVFWTSDNEIIYVKDELRDGNYAGDATIRKINLTNGTDTEFMSFHREPIMGLDENFYFSPKGKKLASEYSGPGQVEKSLLVIDMDSKTTQYPVRGNNQFIRGWLNDGLVYSTINNDQQSISKNQADGKNTILFDLPSSDLGGFRTAKDVPVFLLGLTQSKWQLFSYDERTKKHKEIKLPMTFLLDFDISADGKIAALGVFETDFTSQGLYVINLDSEQQSEVCNTDCRYPRWMIN